MIYGKEERAIQKPHVSRDEDSEVSEGVDATTHLLRILSVIGVCALCIVVTLVTGVINRQLGLNILRDFMLLINPRLDFYLVTILVSPAVVNFMVLVGCIVLGIRLYFMLCLSEEVKRQQHDNRYSRRSMREIFESELEATVVLYGKTFKIKRRPKLQKTCLFIATVVVLFHVVGFGVYCWFIISLDDLLASSVDISFDRVEDVVTIVGNTQFAIFNECCAAKNYTVSGAVPRCSATGEVDLEACFVPSELELFKEDLCACHTISEDSYEELTSSIQAIELCPKLELATVEIDPDDVIPGTGIRLSLIFPVTEVPVVGFHEAALEDGTGGSGFGCGTGHARGFQLILFERLRQGTSLIAFLILGFSFVQLLCFIGIIAELTCSVPDVEEDEYQHIVLYPAKKISWNPSRALSKDSKSKLDIGQQRSKLVSQVGKEQQGAMQPSVDSTVLDVCQAGPNSFPTTNSDLVSEVQHQEEVLTQDISV